MTPTENRCAGVNGDVTELIPSLSICHTPSMSSDVYIE